jgi:predicted alpha/beta-hydrolase family hydrolase
MNLSVPIEWRVPIGDGDETSALFEAAPGADAVFICAHGAGGRMDDRGMVSLVPVFHRCGLSVVRFNFLYRERGSRRPDPMPQLQACLASVVAFVRQELHPSCLILGGRSMGGRAASMLAATGFACDGLLLLAYPLHPAGRPERLRDAHLPSLRLPVLCCNGTRDSLCRRDLMEQTLQTVTADWTMHWLEAADHGFHVLKSSGRTDADVLREIGEATRAWLPRLGRSTR